MALANLGLGIVGVLARFIALVILSNTAAPAAILSPNPCLPSVSTCGVVISIPVPAVGLS